MSRNRKKHTEDKKARVALEAIKGVRTLSELSATYGVHLRHISSPKEYEMEIQSTQTAGRPSLKSR